MRGIHRAATIVLVALSAFPGRAPADIAPDPMTAGRPIAPYDDAAAGVRMVEEDVSVRIFEDSIVTVAVFLMHNEGATIDMQVGFPFFYPQDLLDFRASVDGRPVAVSDTTKENVGRKKSTIQWKLWDMTFLSGERCTVRIEYRTKPFLHPAARFGMQNRYMLPVDVCESMKGASMIGTAEYYLATGERWKGALDRCRVSFELVGLSDAHIMGFSPDDGAMTGGTVVWEYADYEPAGVVSLRYCPNMPVDEIPGFLRGVVDQFPGYAPLASDIGSTLGSYFGRRDVQRDIYHSFLAKWDEPIPQLMEYAAGGRCRFNYQAEGHFYTVWRMAYILFEDYCREGLLDRARDIAPNVARMTAAVVDSLDTCHLTKQDEALKQKALELLYLSTGLVEEAP